MYPSPIKRKDLFIPEDVYDDLEKRLGVKVVLLVTDGDKTLLYHRYDKSACGHQMLRIASDLIAMANKELIHGNSSVHDED